MRNKMEDWKQQLAEIQKVMREEHIAKIKGEKN